MKFEYSANALAKVLESNSIRVNSSHSDSIRTNLKNGLNVVQCIKVKNKSDPIQSNSIQSDPIRSNPIWSEWIWCRIGPDGILGFKFIASKLELFWVIPKCVYKSFRTNPKKVSNLVRCKWIKNQTTYIQEFNSNKCVNGVNLNESLG